MTIEEGTPEGSKNGGFLPFPSNLWIDGERAAVNLEERNERGRPGFDGGKETRDACRAVGDS
jgi:hypothetical protein